LNEIAPAWVRAAPLKPSVRLHIEDPFVLHPNQFHVNEAWIAFKLNDAPMTTRSDGDFNFIALMDAASCFILSSALVPASAAEPSKMEAKRLLKEGQAHKQQVPKTLFIPSDQPASLLTVEAERQGITVVRVPEDQLLLFITDAREGFRESFSGGSKQ
jgi:hypothetical protein